MKPVQGNRRWSLQEKRIVHRTLQADPGQEYYIYVPSTVRQDAPLWVVVHGISRNAFEQAKLFAPYSEALGMVLVAPHFPAERIDGYQRLGRPGMRADQALNSILEEVTWLTSANTSQFYLFGYSGGAQFAHRYTMVHPHRVSRAAIASAGWYTFPDPRRRFPFGIRTSRELPELRFDPEEFLRIPCAVFVGANDIAKASLRRSASLNRQQGKTRVTRARSWVDAMRAAAVSYGLEPLISYEEIPGGIHSFKQLMTEGHLGDKVCRALFDQPLISLQVGGNGGGSSVG